MKENKLYLYLIILHSFVGLGALFGGIGVIIDPSGSGYGISTDLLKNSPFEDFFIPGLILFFFIGLCDIIVAVLAYRHFKYQPYLSGVMGCGLMIFIIVQCIMIESIVFLHVIYFILGMIEVILAFTLMYHKNLFPISNIKKKIK